MISMRVIHNNILIHYLYVYHIDYFVDLYEKGATNNNLCSYLKYFGNYTLF